MRLASYIARGRTSFGAVLGDVVEISCPELGVLRNPVVDEP